MGQSTGSGRVARCRDTTRPRMAAGLNALLALDDHSDALLYGLVVGCESLSLLEH
ncbi:hypothetical protein AWB78_02382 [Caballeronia calidae]|uniref:Uncharacterized protein n=1 Tax=Caballeronia calidae TaxID=1777139 RepID=A0A158B872_9BURK|nr:hypothetical protein AWB78_02382 [Caballeronia calidae]